MRLPYLEASPLTVETTLSRANRVAPTGTSTARSAITCAFWTRVLGWVEDVLGDVRRLLAAVLLVRVPVDAGLRLVVVRFVVVVGFCVPGVLVAIGFCLSTKWV